MNYHLEMEWNRDHTLYPEFLQSPIKRGRGIGFSEKYKPWIHKRDVPSKGTSGSIGGVWSGREHWLLSTLEKAYFFELERMPTVVDIREQWPILDINRTIELAAKFGVRHKTNIKTGYPEPYTVDFLVTERINGKIVYSARSVKTPEDAAKVGTQKKLAIEHAWFTQYDTPWTNMVTGNYSNTLLDTLHFMREWYRNHYEPNRSAEAEFVRVFKKNYTTGAVLEELTQQCAKKLHLDHGLAVNRFRYCAWSNKIPLYVSEKLAMNEPVHLILNPK